MALTAVQTVMGHEDKKAIHPFFAKPTSRTIPPEESNVTQASSEAEGDNELDSKQTDPDAPKRRKRSRKALKEGDEDKTACKVQASLQKFGCGVNGRVQNAAEGAGPPLSAELVTSDVLEGSDIANRARRKRRKTSPPAASHGNDTLESGNNDWQQQLQVEAMKVTDAPSSSTVDTDESYNSFPGSGTVASSLGKQTDGADDGEEDGVVHGISSNIILNASTDATPKRRMVKVSKNGKLLSSPDPLESDKSASANGQRKRGKRSQKSRPSFNVVIRYGINAQDRQRIGQKIEDILNGRVGTVRPVTPKKTPSHPPLPAKPTHPFFLGKAPPKAEYQVATAPALDDAPSAPKTLRKTAVTPGKLIAETQRHQGSQQTSVPLFGSVRGGGSGPRSAGAIEAAWPNSDSLHVRDIGSDDFAHVPPNPIHETTHFRPRKQKYNIVNVPQEQDLLVQLSQQLKQNIHGQNLGSKVESGSSRLPHRLLTTGIDIQSKVRKEISAYPSPAHAAVQVHFEDIEHVLTPFDKGICESQSWVHKYGPTMAAQVLQVGKEAAVLRDWLQNLTVKSVQGQRDATLEGGASDSKKPPRKKRKKMEDDFIVSSDEDADDELVEISENEEYGSSDLVPHRARSLKRSRMSRNKNVVIISGPHGCGKSATVYAVAKELCYEVFEINSGSRRSGKDILDRVGDMSENHLVNQGRGETSDKDNSANKEESTQDDLMSEALQRDIQSGRQGTMTSFFKSAPRSTRKAATTAKTKPPAEAKKKALKLTGNKSQASLPAVPKLQPAQKQSLILFEEADILFQEDQQFWAHVTKLAHHSKRPIIITCNNEGLVPTWDLPVAAILRLSPVPISLATDYMITLAAKEGHILENKAVAQLYQSRGFDLRASITELNFWCQMAIGDQKGGLEWIYQRWPPGKDVDQNGRTIRVASEATYISGTGMLPQDTVNAVETIGFDKEHLLLKDAWKDWGLRPNAREPPKQCVHSDTGPSSGSNLDALHGLDRFLDALSSVDLYSRVGLPSYYRYEQEPTDSTLPPIPDKERLNYTSDAPVLQVDHLSDFSDFDTDIFVQINLDLERHFGSSATGVAPGVTSVNRYNELIEIILQDTANKLTQNHIARPEFSAAFDILATPSSSTPSISSLYPLTASAFDRNFSIVVEDLAPYVRSIVSHEQRLEAERLRLSNLLCEGGRSKRPRTTRASRVALEGGTRGSKRRERWFDKDLNRELVMRTAGQSWAGLGTNTEDIEGSSITGGSLGGTQEG
ncbi:uncharacterized protein EI97DRAFT_410794 [Westerdykella ornata]|uniref:AAA+ ATPase domain-containing protein n=1 Tax=Westerdykella ornata TaxID=318751 RepID=A0A6A6JUM0_WESOR|nr:uncharacterized protein EI97DRAFT_410794 [Westerdykella ornata]KAF2279945.1 hypothetical protein EI97DRAFT_410794 [Westerdykella ornata]